MSETQDHSDSYQRVQTVEVGPDEDSRRLDNFLISRLSGVPHSRVYRLIRTGQVRVNGGRAKPKQRLRQGDIVRIPPIRISDGPPRITKPDAKLKHAVRQVLYDDDYIIAVDKPSGITVHSGTRHTMGLVEALRYLRPDLPFIELVHRIDKGTSGIVILAKNKLALRKLHAQWRREEPDKTPVKKYVALLKSNFTTQTIEVDLQQRNRHSKVLRSTLQTMPLATGTTSSSRFVELQRLNEATLAEITIYTGRTHQARLHAQSVGHPIAGDKKYGDKIFNRQLAKLGLKRLFLHASSVQFQHPVMHDQVLIESPLPEELTSVLKMLEPNSGDHQT